MADKTIFIEWECDSTVNGYDICVISKGLPILTVEITDPDEKHLFIPVNRAKSKHFKIFPYSYSSTGEKEHLEPIDIKKYEYDPPILNPVKRLKKGLKISWQGVPGISYYRLYKKTKGNKWEELVQLNGTQFIDRNVESGIRYYYTVRCINEGGTKNLSSFDKNGVKKTFFNPGEQITW